jgi:hypothetical protein
MPKIFYVIAPIMLLLLLSGCEKKDTDPGKIFLVRVDDRVLTVVDFNNAFEITKIAYENDIKEHPEELKKARVRLLNQLIVEMILLERAEELGIGITDAEFEKAESEIKSDYPEGEFENTLLEFAVSYDSWKDRLKKRLVQEKVVEEELGNRITITPEDISQFYQKNYGGQKNESTPDKNEEDINETIVKHLRRQKAEEAYSSWIEDLKGQYRIEINNEQWEKVTGSKSIEKGGNTVNDVSKIE